MGALGTLDGGGAVRAPRGGLSSARHSPAWQLLRTRRSCWVSQLLREGPAGTHTRRPVGRQVEGERAVCCPWQDAEWPASLGLPRGGFGTGQGFGACGPAAGPGGGLCLPCEEVPFLTSKMEAGALHFRGHQKHSPACLRGLRSRLSPSAGLAVRLTAMLVTILPLEFFFLRAVGNIF